MALRDHEKRILADIERQLVRESPTLAQRFAELQPLPLSSLVAAGLGLLMVLSTGVAIVVVGALARAPVAVVAGGLMIVFGLTMAGWVLHQRRGLR